MKPEKKPEKQSPQIADHASSSVEADTTAELVFQTPDARNIGLPEPQLLDGPRQTGSFELPNGNTVIAETTPDGMKQTRVVSTRSSAPRPKSAKEFYESKGMSVGTAPEQEQEYTGRLRKFASFVLAKARNRQ